ncbi:hypothetical protein [Nitrosomonas sp.]|uniref:hypothetical protein n=1 Tax=Nitrosomonas sp. TaxID=42353 RepID=UPI002616520D|nr:hypothetical protein [Nitrosomonas sp.]
MENPGLKPATSHWQNTLTQPAIASIFLALLCLGLHHSVLSGGWRFDDGDHLNFASTYAPWQYFLMPEITRLQSGANLTPWNTLFYDINLSLFGLNPTGFYMHQLMLIWLTSVATYFLLKLWIAPLWSLMGAVIFLVGAPTVHIANEIMTGHYASGLLFTVIALYAYVRAVREQRVSLALIGTLFYLLAVTCKEIYVPLIAILPFLPVGTLKDRLRFALPFSFVALAYIFWRLHVLGRLFGGYNLGGNYDFLLIIETFSNLPFFLFGNHLAGKLAVIIIGLFILYWIYRRQVNLKLTAVALGLLLFPLIPLVNFPGISAPDRYLYFIGWGLALFLAYLFSLSSNKLNTQLAWLAGIILISISWMHSREEQQNLLNMAMPTEKSYEFMLNSHANQVYIESNFNYYFGAVLPGAVATQKKLVPSSPDRARIVPDMEQLAAIDLTHVSVWSYSDACRCVEDVTSTLPARVADYHNKLTQRALSVSLHIENLKATWHFGPYQDGEYAIMINNQGFFPLPRSGAHSYPRKTLEGYILYKSPQGWITKSPQFHIDALSQSKWEWSRR